MKVMKENEIKVKAMRQIFDHVILCEWSLVDVHRLFDYMWNCLWYRRQFREAQTPETTALARWSRDTADTELSKFMNARCLPPQIRDSVWFLVNMTK